MHGRIENLGRKAVSGIMLMLLLTSMLTWTFDTLPVEASGTIYIRADGSIDPPTANIASVDNITYTFTGNINDSIVVERDNVVVDGTGYTLQGTGVYDSKGIFLTGRSNVAIKKMEIRAFYYGICLLYSSHISIHGNNISNNTLGIELYEYSNNNTISGNNMANNDFAIGLKYSSNNSIYANNISVSNEIGIVFRDFSDYNSISGNNVTANRWAGIGMWFSSNNIFYHNNFINNTNHASTDENSVNAWDNGVEGNYWSNYIGVDVDGDGIGDTPYEVNENNTDRYPLMKLWSPTSAEEVPFWMQWWFWTIVIAVIAALAVAVYFLKKRKS